LGDQFVTDQFVTDLFVVFTEIASAGVAFAGEREPLGGFGSVGELGSNDVQQFLGGDVAARCFGVEPQGKFFNGDRHRLSLGSSPALLVAFELSALSACLIAITAEPSIVVLALVELAAKVANGGPDLGKVVGRFEIDLT
jgi:hypothetical protein